MEKGDFIEIIIEDMSNEGNGIGHTKDGMTVFVSNAVVGDRVRAGITQVKKNYALAKMVSVIEKSNVRQDDEKVCPYIDKCGGCAYGKLNYTEQLRLKEKSVKDKLERLGGVDFSSGNAVMNPIISMDEPYNYRNKATISVFDDLVGFKGQKSNMVVDCEFCMIQSERANQAATALRNLIKEDKKNAVFSKMVVRVTTLDECMVLLYTKNFEALKEQKKASKDNKYSKYAKKSAPVKKFDISTLDLEKISFTIDDYVENTLESIWIDDQLVAGKKTILDQAGDLEFEISPLSFYQTNHTQMIKLYDKVVEYADLKKGDTILDLYCGVGTIGLYMINELNKKNHEEDGLENGISEAHDEGRVIGIESVKPAVIDANRNAVINHIVNARYVAGKAEEELPFMMGMMKLYKPNEVNEMVERTPEITVEHADCVVLDPPRAGCDKKLLEAVVKAEPDRIVYVSCDPGTLARDIKFLNEGVMELGYSGYEVREVTPCDMFPHTAHVESVCLLSKVNTRDGLTR